MENEQEILEETAETTPEQEEAAQAETDTDTDAAKQEQDVETVDAGDAGEKEADAEEDSSTEEKKENKKFFKTKEKADKKKDKNKEKIEELEDKVKRQMAEFDNFRKRTEKEKAQMFEVGAKSVIEKILPIVDNFERGLMNVPEDENSKAFVEGMQMIYKQMLTELENIGVKPIEAVGVEFNPDFHNAVMQVESEEYESGYVAQELLKGYTYRETVVRHSMVAVVQ